MNTVIYPSSAAAPKGSYSPAIKNGFFLFISGQSPTDPVTGKIIGSTDVCDQVKQTMENIKTLVHAAGMNMDQIVKITVYLKNIDDFQQYDEVYRTYFTGRLPTRTTVEIDRFRDSRLVEIDAIAMDD